MTAPRLALFGAAAVCALLSWAFASAACNFALPYAAAIALTWCCLAAAVAAAYAVGKAIVR